MNKNIEQLKKSGENYCVFDTETLGVVDPSIYDLGYTISNGDKILVSRGYLVKEIWENKELMNTAYYKEKIPRYEHLLALGEIEVKPFLWILRKWYADLYDYEVNNMAAYNLGFDLRAVRHSLAVQGLSTSIYNFIFGGKRLIDLWLNSANILFKTSDYRDFVEENNHYTEKGNRKGTAEVAYQFITNDLHFIEDHMALSDAIIETKILHELLDSGEPIQYGVKAQVWTIYNQDIIKKKKIQISGRQ